MSGETIQFEMADDPAARGSSREQSSIAFPYLDLDAAAEVADAVYQRSGHGSCDLDELAAEMGQVISGSFRLKTGTAKVFDVIDKDGRSSVKLTELGKQITQPDTAKAAKVDAFLSVPLYAAVYEKYKGQRLPPMKALEREMQNLGVSSKQTDRARQAFERSARQAGFFEAGDDRLVRPKTDLITVPQGSQDDSRDKQQRRADDEDRLRRERERNRHGGDGNGPDDPLIVGLVQRLPETTGKWDAEARAAWLRLAVSIFDVVYGKAEADISVEAKSKGAGRE
jgi:hypothetical protein